MKKVCAGRPDSSPGEIKPKREVIAFFINISSSPTLKIRFSSWTSLGRSKSLIYTPKCIFNLFIRESPWRLFLSHLKGPLTDFRALLRKWNVTSGDWRHHILSWTENHWPTWKIWQQSLRPGSDAVLQMSQIEFEFRPTQINLDGLNWFRSRS